MQVWPGRWEPLNPAGPPRVPTTAWVGLPVTEDGVPGPMGTATPRRPSLSTDHCLGRTPHDGVLGLLGTAARRKRSLRTYYYLGKTPCPPRVVCLGRWELLPPQALLGHRPPPGWDPRSPQACVPGPLGAATSIGLP